MLAGIVFLAYMPALWSGFVWDDPSYITDNVSLRSWNGLWRIWFDPKANTQYYPLVFASWWIEYFFFGLRPFSYHFVNVLLHAGNSLLLWRVLLEMQIPGSWLAAAIFAVHPVHVESVAWATERKDALSGFFSLLAALLWNRFLNRGKERDYLSALALFVCALLSKAAVCPLPAVFAMTAWWKRKRIGRSDLLRTIPFFLLSLGMGLLHVWVERRNMEPIRGELREGVIERILIAGRAVWFYFGKLLWPLPLTTIYRRWKIEPFPLVRFLYPILTVGVALTIWLSRRRWGRGLFLALAVFLAMAAPALGLLMGSFFRISFVADHFQYLASIGPTTLFAALWDRSMERVGSRLRFPRTAANGILLLFLGALAWRQSATYRDAETFWRANLAVNPESWMSHNQLGLALVAQSKMGAAKEQFEEALRLNPDSFETHFNLGQVLNISGRNTGALAEFEQALRLYPDDPKILNKVAILHAKAGRADEAIREAEKVLSLQPNSPEAHFNLGSFWDLKGNADQAILHYSEALRLKPDLSQAHNDLGILLAKRGEMESAIEHFSLALKFNPDSRGARANLEKARAAKQSTLSSKP